MNCIEAKKIDIVSFLERIGFAGAEKGGFFWCRSPFRNENTASFRVDQGVNTWKDFGTGQTGDITDLVKLIYSTDTSGALQLLSDFQIKDIPVPAFVKHEKMDKERRVIITQVLPLQSKSCIWYLRNRKISSDIANIYTKEIHYTVDGNPLFSVGFKNDNGGFAIRNKFFKGCLSLNGITTIQGNIPGELNIFEGFISFLSMLVYNKTERPDYDTIVLNSLVNMEHVIPQLKNYHKVNSYLDNDFAGRRGRDQIIESHSCVIDKSKSIYPNSKDFNDYLMGV